MINTEHYESIACSSLKMISVWILNVLEISWVFLFQLHQQVRPPGSVESGILCVTLSMAKNGRGHLKRRHLKTANYVYFPLTPSTVISYPVARSYKS